MIALNGLLSKLEKVDENWVFKPQKKGPPIDCKHHLLFRPYTSQNGEFWVDEKKFSYFETSNARR